MTLAIIRKYIQRNKQNNVNIGSAQRYAVDFDTSSTLVTAALAVRDFESTQQNLNTWTLSTDSTLLASINEQIGQFRRDFSLDFVDCVPDANFRTF